MISMDFSLITAEQREALYNEVWKDPVTKPNFEELTDDELRNNEELSLLTNETKVFIKATCSKIQVPGQLRNPHKLIIDHEKESLYRKYPEKRERDKSKVSYSVHI